ncbi:putative ABC transporter ATP-binding protein YwjA [Holospora obtusa F1]|uniref:ABC transporter ATP-binding protein YwjA n=1 Tax=Holospora obtusa F1 TaxID=1399147 RepID=W6TEK8_HOLOB|nr:ABC transporter ATP-binding protein [Holospora obtusa]ETZ07244.1 putative ABC transporter ATP-binding protein YwjA [Holospora obtusa F1]
MNRQRIKRFFSYYKPYTNLFYTDLACSAMVSIITLALPFCVRYITKHLLKERSLATLNDIYFMGGVMIILLIIYIACKTFVNYKGHTMGALMEGAIRNDLFEHYQKLSFSFYDEHRIGALMTRISNDSLNISELYHHGPEDMMISLVNFIGAFLILNYIDLRLTFISLSFLPIMGIYGYYFSSKMHAALKKNREKINDINVQVEDALSGIRVVKSFTNEEIEKKKFTLVNQNFIESRKDQYKNEAYFYSGLATLTQLMIIVVVIFGSISIVKKSLDLSDLLTFLLYIGILIEPIKRLGNFVRLCQEGFTGFERVMEILEVEPDIKDSLHAIENIEVQGNIEFRNVSFKYKTDHDYILNNLSLSIKSGEYIALVGPSGVGKTTLCSLIPRFYEVNTGEIFIDGKNINQITKRSLRKHIGIVQQDTYLFLGTILENIRYGKPNASYEEVILAAKQANAHDFIMALPRGYDTDIGQRGVKLSGGQKQRLSVARVFLKNPPIIIFDEATSSLDNESEKAVQNSLERLIINRTTLVIAHRLSTIRHAQRILVLTDDGVSEQGTHEELLALNGTYATFCNVQLRI